MSPGSRSGAVPGERSLPAELAGWRAGGQRRCGGYPCPARDHAGMQGARGAGFRCVSAVPCPPASLLSSPRLPGVSACLRCLRSCLGKGESRHGEPPEAGKVWGLPGSFPTPLPWLRASGSRPPCGQWCYGVGCSRAESGRPGSPAGLSTSRPF